MKISVITDNNPRTHQFTYAFGGMFKKLGCEDAIFTIREGVKASDILDDVRTAWVLFPRIWDELQIFEDENERGWGTREQALKYLGELLIDLERNPTCWLEFCG